MRAAGQDSKQTGLSGWWGHVCPPRPQLSVLGSVGSEGRAPFTTDGVGSGGLQSGGRPGAAPPLWQMLLQRLESSSGPLGLVHIRPATAQPGAGGSGGWGGE